MLSYESPGGSQTAPDGALTPAAQRAREMAEYTAVLLAPLHVQLKAQAEEIGTLKERVASLQAQLAERDAPAPETQNRAPAQTEERRRWWQRAWGWLTTA